MNIYAKSGEKVVFSSPTNGYLCHQELARKHLAVGRIYTVDYTEVEAFHTDVFLLECPGVAFNSVLFDDVSGVTNQSLNSDVVSVCPHCGTSPCLGQIEADDCLM